jgi:intracellular sulfur oxidation DsrE/DsrF family protein
MLKRVTVVVLFVLPGLAAAQAPAPQWPAAVSPVIAEADGYVAIPRVAVPPDPKRTYRAVFDATRGAKDPSQLAPAINMAGSELNAFGAAKVPLQSARFAIVFHGAGLDGILDDAHYRAKFKRTNPNLKVLSELKKAGVQLFVCGQNLAADHIDPKILSPDVTVASDALIVLIAYQNDGYALMSF